MAPAPQPARETCSAVVVTHHPDAGLPERVARIARQVARVYVVDNGSGEATRRTLSGIAASVPGVEPILLQANEGLGAALNRGVERAVADGFAWVVTLDQDSVVEPELVTELGAILAEHPARERVAVVGPNFVSATGDPARRFPPGAGRWSEAATVITSGALVSTAAWRRVGPFRADYFIDSIDDEFCLRARRSGLRVVSSTRPLMRHALGRATIRRVPWGTVTVSNHGALRRYYMLRNRVLTLKAFGIREPGWALAKLYLTAAELVATPLLEEDGRAKLRAMLVGLWHGLRGRTGAADRAF